MNIKRSAVCLLCMMAAAMCAGCNSSDNTTDTRPAGDRINVESVLEQGIKQNDKTVQSDPIPEQEADRDNAVKQQEEMSATDDDQAGEDGIDVDLTVLSGTMVYSEVYNMMYYPENYIGKTVKMKGAYAVFYDDTTGKYYHGCVISDATACCSQGIEFELSEDKKYPDDYPAQGEEICVTGTFDTYQEGTDTFCTLRNAQLLGPITDEALSY